MRRTHHINIFRKLLHSWPLYIIGVIILGLWTGKYMPSDEGDNIIQRGEPLENHLELAICSMQQRLSMAGTVS